jgi:glutathione S-transferase
VTDVVGDATVLRVLGKATSINVRKVLWLCTELGLPFALEPWATPQRPADDPAFLALNPNGQVPVVVDGDFVLWESNTICRYLAAKHGRSDLLPTPPRARAVVEQWMDWQATELNAAWRYVFMARVRQHSDYRDEQAVARSIDSWNRLMRLFDAQLQTTGTYAAGSAFTLADIGLGLSTQRWRMTPMPKPELSAVAAYCQRLAVRPGWQQYGANGLP